MDIIIIYELKQGADHENIRHEMMRIGYKNTVGIFEQDSRANQNETPLPENALFKPDITPEVAIDDLKKLAGDNLDKALAVKAERFAWQAFDSTRKQE